MTYVYFRVGVENKPACAGGFLRCDSEAETDAFVAQLKQREITFYVEAQ